MEPEMAKALLELGVATGIAAVLWGFVEQHQRYKLGVRLRKLEEAGTRREMTARISLSEADFKQLVAGKSINHRLPTGDSVDIALLDIGWDRMYRAIKEAMDSRDT